MSGIINVVLNDGKATPVVHTFYPISNAPSALWRERVAGLPLAAQGTLSLSVTKSKNGLYKVRKIVSIPVMEEIIDANTNGYTAAPRIAHTLRSDTVSFAHSRSTSDERKDLLALTTNFDADPAVIEAIESLTQPL